MESVGRYKVSVGVGCMHPKYEWGSVLYEMHLSETEDGWKIETMTALIHT